MSTILPMETDKTKAKSSSSSSFPISKILAVVFFATTVGLAIGIGILLAEEDKDCTSSESMSSPSPSPSSPSPSPASYTCSTDGKTSTGYYWTEHAVMLASGNPAISALPKSSGDEVCDDDLTTLLSLGFTESALMGDEIPGFGRFPYITPCPNDVADPTKTFDFGT